MPAVEMIAIGELKLADDNIRTEIGDVEELAASIRSVGILEPLVVREGDHLVVCGARRLVAARKAGVKEVPAMVRAFTDQERLEAMIVENLQREDLAPLEEAAAFKRLAELGLTQRAIAGKLGVSQAHVSKRLGLLSLPEEVQAAVGTGSVKLEEALELTRISDDGDLVVKLVKQKVKAGDSPYAAQTMSRDVQAELDRRARDKRIAAKLAELRKKGEPLVEGDYNEWGGLALPAGAAFVKEQTWNTSEVEMAPAKHAKLKCHAVAVLGRDLDVVEVCTDPGSHPSKADQVKKEREEADRKREELLAQWNEAVVTRREFLAGLLRASVNKDVAIELALLGLAERDRYWNNDEVQWAIACELLALETIEELNVKAGGSAADRTKVVAAIASSKMETTVSEVHLQWGSSQAAYLDLLTRLGHKPSPQELVAKEQASDDDEDGDFLEV